MIDSVGAEGNGKGSQAVYNFGLQNYRPYFACTYVGLLQLIPSRENRIREGDQGGINGTDDRRLDERGGEAGIIRTLNGQLLR